MERRGSALGTSHPDTLAARAELAALLARRSAAEATAEALSLQRSVVEVSETSLGPDHVATLAARAALAGSILRKAAAGSADAKALRTEAEALHAETIVRLATLL